MRSKTVKTNKNDLSISTDSEALNLRLERQQKMFALSAMLFVMGVILLLIAMLTPTA